MLGTYILQFRFSLKNCLIKFEPETGLNKNLFLIYNTVRLSNLYCFTIYFRNVIS